MNETIGIIPRAFRRRGVWVACTLLLRAGLNFLGLAMLLPVLALVLDPGSLEGGGVLTRAYEGLGFASQRTFALAVCAAVVGVIVLKCLLGLWLARVERTYIYDLYRTLSRRLLVTYHDRGLPFVKASNSAVLARNVNVVCLAFAAKWCLKTWDSSTRTRRNMCCGTSVFLSNRGRRSHSSAPPAAASLR